MKSNLVKSSLTFLALLLLASPLQAETGVELYKKHCGECHGKDGLGAKAPSLRKDGLLDTTGIDYIKNTIRYGRKIGGMPSFEAAVSAEEIDSISAFVKSWQKNDTLKAPEHDVEPSDTKRGREIFALCGGCHGLEGEGAMGPALLDPGFLASISDADLRRTIMWGRPGTPMKGYLKGMGGLAVLSDEEIDQVISYIRYRQRAMNPAGR